MTLTKTRSATKDDVESVVKVILASINNNERLWANFVPEKTQQDDEYVKEIVNILLEHMDPANKAWDVQVVDLASKGQTPEIVSVAIWDLSAAKIDSDKKPRQVETSLGDSRTQAYVTMLQKAREQHFGVYSQHRYLQLIATHPSHQVHGYASDLVQAAVDNAKREGGVLTTVAGPLGYILFSGLGFHDVGAVTLPPSSATEPQVVKVMVLVVPKEERRRSIVDSIINYVSS